MIREIFYKQILKELRGAKTIIDIGAGNSLYKYQYGKRKLKFYEFVKDNNGFDITPIDIKPENKDIVEMDYKDINKEYDVFFSSHFIEHISDAINYMEIAQKYCKKYIVTITGKPNKKFWNEPTHTRPHTIQSIKSLYGWYDFTPTRIFNFVRSFCVIGAKDEKKN